jgi:hypothetical protein
MTLVTDPQYDALTKTGRRKMREFFLRNPQENWEEDWAGYIRHQHAVQQARDAVAAVKRQHKDWHPIKLRVRRNRVNEGDVVSQ